MQSACVRVLATFACLYRVLGLDRVSGDISIATDSSAALPQRASGGGRKAYFASLTVAQIAAFARSIALARLLGPEQMGVAAVLVVTAQFFDSVTDTGNDRFLVQDREGDSSAALRLVHVVSVLKGATIAILLILLARPIADFMRVPQAGGAFMALALVPFITGFTNFDFRVAQRDHQFGREAKVVLCSELAGLIATVIAAAILRQFTAVLYGLAARSLTAVLVSQIISRTPYRPRYSTTVARRLWRFGAPLMINGLLLFAATQSDRVIISRALGSVDLGRYSVLILIGVYPSATLMKFVATVFLPLITASLHKPSGRSNVRQLESLTLLLALGMGVGFAWVVPTLLPLIFGPAFRSSPITITLVGLIVAWRMMKTAPTTVAIASGHTEIVLANNLCRLSGVGAAIVGLYVIGGLAGVAAGLIIGEMIANTMAMLLLNWKMKWPIFYGLGRFAIFTLVSSLLVVSAYAYRWPDRIAADSAALVCLGLLLGTLVKERVALADLRQSFRVRTPS